MSRRVRELRARIGGDNSKSLDNIADKSLGSDEEEGIGIGIGEGTVRLRDNLIQDDRI